jgi:hypothetical protein
MAADAQSNNPNSQSHGRDFKLSRVRLTVLPIDPDYFAGPAGQTFT